MNHFEIESIIEENSDWELIDDTEIFVLSSWEKLKGILEYEREYETLDKEELINLIYKAKEERWKALDLSNCGLREIPSEIGLLEDLEYLDLGTEITPGNLKGENQNKFSTLPPEFGNLKNLKELSLYETEIKLFPKEICDLNNLLYINLNGNKFKSFPEEIIQLSKLEFLAIDYNIIPSSIKKMKELKYLYLPDYIGNTLPEAMGELTNLTTLYLGRSNVEALPSSFKSLFNLESLYLQGTPLYNEIPPEIFKQPALQVIDYILRYQNDQNKVILNESKMIIVGQGGVGKTTLLNKIINDSYIESPSTEGIDIEKWEFKIDKNDYLLNIWDFGGQEIYHSTHQFFLTKRSLYIFVWDSRQEDEYGRIDYWLNTIQSFADDSPIVIVINKCDRDRKNVKIPDYDELNKRFPQIVGIFNVSCQDDINIVELKNEIMKQSKDLPLMETVWFSSWVEIRNILELLSRERNIITYEEYLKICSEKSIESKEALSLITYLHDLGVVLHFHNDNLLKDIVILSPEWGTDAVYKILDAQSNLLKDRNGILFYEDLENIWSDKVKYPTSIYPYVLKLMENFQLSFTLENHKVYLIPELLGNSPNENSIVTDEDSLFFRYSYKFLPAGIMTKFIVKAHELLIDENGTKLCWRKGAYLKHKGAICKAILYDGITERYIDIQVTGGRRRDRSELLSYVRSIFDSIHRNITKIDFIELVQCNCSIGCDYLHNYNYLLRLEKENKYTERCQHSLKDVDLLKLLDGIELAEGRNKEMVKINFNPTINNSPNINVSTENNLINKNTITVEIKSNLYELQGHINELLTEVPEEARQDVERMAESLQHVDNFNTKEDILKSGALSKIKRVLEELADPESSVGKVIEGTKYGYSILQDIAGKYNSIAEWCALPTIPKVLLKK